MNTKRILMIVCALLTMGRASGATYYVKPGGSDAAAGTNWVTAFQTISNAVARSSAGDTVVVTNGKYSVSVPVNIAKAITVRGASGNPRDTVIDGQGVTSCLTMNSSGAFFAGFTLTNGFALKGAGGIVNNGVVSNCVVTGNRANSDGGGLVLGVPSGSATIRLFDCLVANNTSLTNRGGGIYAGDQFTSVVLNRCVVSNNISGGAGGGLYSKYGGVCAVSNSLFYGNWSTNSVGGGLCQGYSAGLVIESSTFARNVARVSGGGIYTTTPKTGSAIRNCLIRGNRAEIGEYGTRGAGGVSLSGANMLMSSCTIVENDAGAARGGGLFLGDAFLKNCIIYRNTATNQAAQYAEVNLMQWYRYTNAWNTCESKGQFIASQNNITSDPKFANVSAGDFQLQRTSPCFNKGTNEIWMVTARDLLGAKRICGPSVDMGAYEYVYAAGFVIVVK